MKSQPSDRQRRNSPAKPIPKVAQDASDACHRLKKEGYVILQNVLSRQECRRWASEIAAAFELDSGNAIAGNRNRVIGGRNLQAVWFTWKEAVCRSPVHDFLVAELAGQPGAETTQSAGGRAHGGFGLVRILYFDKPPGQTWNLAPHQDKTIAVDRHHENAEPYGKPTIKAKVAHVEADPTLLHQMLTLRFHLDDMHAGNGPLNVLPRTHQQLSSTAMMPHDSVASRDSVEIHCEAGDVFAMKPLLVHGSKSSDPNCPDNRRVVHLEFAPYDALAAPYRWHRYDDVTVAESL